MSNLVIRLDRLGQRFRPLTCWSDGPRCVTYRFTDGTERPSELPALCAACGRPIEARVIALHGVDVDRI